MYSCAKLKHHFHYNSIPTYLLLHIYKMNSFIYVISTATVSRIYMYLLTVKYLNFTCSFYNHCKFSVVQKMLCTPWPQNLVTSSRLSASAASGLGDNFSLDTLKKDFAVLIQLFSLPNFHCSLNFSNKELTPVSFS
jgi:hypothetical protein